jgi:hypothetical protein
MVGVVYAMPPARKESNIDELAGLALTCLAMNTNKFHKSYYLTTGIYFGSEAILIEILTYTFLLWMVHKFYIFIQNEEY